MIDEKLPLVIIIGRTNVGKSTLFNRLIEKNQALVSPIENTTRDFNINKMNWRGFDFQVLDTAGVSDSYALKKKMNVEEGGVKRIEQKVQKQVYELIKKADLLLFVVDNKAGLLKEDKNIVSFLKKRNYQKRTILVANKVDNFRQVAESFEFNKLSLNEPVPISALTGSGTGDLLDLIIEYFEKNKKGDGQKEDEKSIEAKLAADKDKINLCIIGKPNVGKSSLLNSLLGYERVIVSEIPHTTREPQNTELMYKNRLINLIDTAGINKMGKKSEGLEKYGIIKSLKSLREADIILLVIDINDEITRQDSKLIEEIMNQGKSFIIVANKWDLIEDRSTKYWTREININFPFIVWAPIVFVSALKGEKVDKIFDLVLRIDAARKIKISDTGLSRFLAKMIKKHKPTKGRGVKHPRIYSLRQTWTNPPKFEVRIGSQEDLHDSYLRFLENRLREDFDFFGSPVRVSVKKNKKIHGVAG
ncbi:ribosome biogenesis GTPase Der [Candidatus Falkowbacteria bacterium HGW-Falkowbacteria-1]|jgi:GTP-binding protein|uniref:GTPase Der n=1 Tax=Candidatus Falkowbacteria bacterium HGW-Falkowbacteria-1 TaxID=2013768 RepID=A0A2N2E8V8_9BACT|nr:MAG: ribosome biogenesis GTPase Der [Candidatus Falkowbacteria bacterium HGW-Falkowbacteria-1]